MATIYVPTGRGRFAQCPDHGSWLRWEAERGVYACPTCDPDDENREAYEIDPRDVYLEHDEGFRTHMGCLWVDEYDEVPA